MRRHRYAAIKQVVEEDPPTEILHSLGEPQQGGRSGVVRYAENTNFRGRGRDKYPRIDRGDRYLSPADELGRSRHEIDEDRVVRTVGLDIQGQQGQEGFSVPDVPHISQDLSGDRLVMTGSAVKHQGTIPVCR